MSVSTFLKFSIFLILFLFLTENIKAEITEEQLEKFLNKLVVPTKVYLHNHENIKSLLEEEEKNCLKEYGHWNKKGVIDYLVDRHKMSFKNIITEMKGKYNNILFQDPTEIKRDFDISYLIMNLNRFQHEGVQGVQLECGCYFFEGYLIQKMIENNKFCPSCSQPITIKGKEFITDEDEESSSSSSSTNNINEKFMQFGINESTIPEFNCSTSLHSQVINEPCSYCNYAINQEEKFSFCVECGNAFHIECVLNYWTGNPLKNGHCPKCDKLNDKSSSDNIQNEKTAYTLADLLKLPHTPGNGGVKELFNNSNNKYSPERELISDNQDLGRHSKHRKNKKKKNKGVFNCGSSLFSCGKSKNSRHSP